MALERINKTVALHIVGVKTINLIELSESFLDQIACDRVGHSRAADLPSLSANTVLSFGFRVDMGRECHTMNPKP